MSKWYPVFISGNHTDSKGRREAWTPERVARLANNLPKQALPPKVVISHPQKGQNEPIFGTVKAAKLDEQGRLFVQYDRPDPILNHYPFPSIGVKKDPLLGEVLDHVAYYGSAPTAVGGLGPHEFSASEDIQVYEFMNNDDYLEESLLAGMLGVVNRIRDYLTDTVGSDDAEKYIPRASLDELTAQLAQLKTEHQLEAQKEALTQPMTTETTYSEGSVMDEQQLLELRKKAEKADLLEAQFAEFQAEQAKKAAQQLEADAKEFVEALHKKGVITTAREKASVLIQYKSLAASDPVEYEFAVGQKETISPLSAFKQDWVSRPTKLVTGELLVGDEDPAAYALADDEDIDVSQFAGSPPEQIADFIAARQLMAKDPQLTIIEAAKRVERKKAVKS